MATSFSGGRSLSIRREPPTMGKQLVNFITCGCDSNAKVVFYTIWLSNLLALSPNVPDEGYSRNASFSLNFH
jgi:hypothetical protein